MKIFFLSLLFGFLFLVVRTALLGFFFPHYLIPDLILILIFYIGVYLPSWGGALVPFSLGYFADSFAGGIIGINSFSLTSIFLVLYLLSKKMDFNMRILRLTGVAVAGVMKGLIVLILLIFMDPQREIFRPFIWSVLPNVLVTVCVSPFFFHIFDRLGLNIED